MSRPGGEATAQLLPPDPRFHPPSVKRLYSASAALYFGLPPLDTDIIYSPVNFLNSACARFQVSLPPFLHSQSFSITWVWFSSVRNFWINSKACFLSRFKLVNRSTSTAKALLSGWFRGSAVGSPGSTHFKA